MVSVAFGNVSLALEVFTDQFTELTLRSFMSCYKTAVDEMCMKPDPKEEAFEKAVWLDIVRWVVAARASRMRRCPHNRSWVFRIGEMFRSVEYDPWCAYCLGLGVGCKECPMVTHKIVKPIWNLALCGADSFLYCALFGSVSQTLALACHLQDFGFFKKTIRRELHRLPVLKMWKVERNGDNLVAI